MIFFRLIKNYDYNLKMASVFKKMNVVMNLLIPVKHALRTNIGLNVMSAVNTFALGLKLGLEVVQCVRFQAICYRARSVVQ